MCQRQQLLREGQGRVCTPARLASVQPASRQSLHSLCFGLPPCSGLRPETRTSSAVIGSKDWQQRKNNVKGEW